MPSIRPARFDEAALLAAVDARCNPTPWTEQLFQAALTSPHDTVLIIGEDEKLQGFIVWRHMFDELELHLIATAPEYRHQGLAAQLLRQMFQAAAENGVSRILLEVRAGNTAAQALYCRHGFVQTAVRRGYYGGEDAVLMEKPC